MSEGQGRGPGLEGNINQTYRRTLDAIERRTDAQDLIDLDKLTREHGADLQPSHIARADAITADLDKLAARYDAAFQAAGRSAEQAVLSLREGVESALIEQRREREAVPGQHQPTLYVVAGPNGSGKSTITRAGAFADARIVDPDAIARHLSPDDPEGASASAGREAIRERIRAMGETGTTLPLKQRCPDLQPFGSSNRHRQPATRSNCITFPSTLRLNPLTGFPNG
ncbi:hypothetical protein [Phaeobacter inhibens]|uniref:hypothetical protein n=1 Tax=Phaeobacter inhibens TaxID=221822 RepID=UPI0021A5E6E3|nr:hypothetical protein [Phaeobacter inhibens]